MSLYITAQLIGFLGYLFLSGAPYLKTKNNNIRVEVLACTLLSLQWHMLCQPGLVTMNILNVVLSACALKANNSKLVEKALPLFYPLSFIIILWFSKGTVIDALCLIGFFSLITSKRAKEMYTFRSQAMLAALAFTAIGILALSVPAALFNTIRFLMHSYRLWKLPKLQATRIKPTLHPALT